MSGIRVEGRARCRASFVSFVRDSVEFRLFAPWGVRCLHGFRFHGFKFVSFRFWGLQLAFHRSACGIRLRGNNGLRFARHKKLRAAKVVAAPRLTKSQREVKGGVLVRCSRVFSSVKPFGREPGASAESVLIENGRADDMFDSIFFSAHGVC